MAAKFEVSTDLEKRIVFARMSGVFTEPELRSWAKQYRAATDAMGGKRHIVVADMRGMKTLNPTFASIMGEEIMYARQRGTVLCAHVSDDVVQRLQAARIARKNSASDEVTIDVDSMEEAQKVVEAYRKYLDDPRYPGSIRGAVASGP